MKDDKLDRLKREHDDVQQKLEKLNRERDRYDGALEQRLEQIETKYGCSSITEAKKLHAKVVKQAEKAIEEFRAAKERLEKMLEEQK